MGYNASGGHGYSGNQPRGSSNYVGKSKRQATTDKALVLKKTVDPAIIEPASFILVAQAPQTWDQPAWSSELPNNIDLQKLAFELLQANSRRKIELQVIDSETKKTTKYLLRKIEEVEQQLPEDEIMPIEGQSFEAHQHVANLSNQLRTFGWTLVQVQQKGLTL